LTKNQSTAKKTELPLIETTQSYNSEFVDKSKILITIDKTILQKQWSDRIKEVFG
jgi:hypothetical protein